MLKRWAADKPAWLWLLPWVAIAAPVFALTSSVLDTLIERESFVEALKGNVLPTLLWAPFAYVGLVVWEWRKQKRGDPTEM
jgi:hypothetical protein